MWIQPIKGDKIVQPVKDHKTAHQQQHAVSGSELRRLLAGEALATEIRGSLAMFVKESHHLETGQHHDGHKENVSYYDTTYENFWSDVMW